MPFYGQEELSEAPGPVDRPLRTYSYRTWGGKHKEVEANFIRFESGHISFWLDRPEPNVQDTLVLAELNAHVTELKELF